MNRSLFAILALSLLPGAVRADDWPQWLGPRRDGTSLDKALVETFPQDSPKVLWQRDVGEGYSGPVIAGDRLVLFHRIDNEERVECLNASTGKLIWKFAYPTEYQDALGKGNGPRRCELWFLRSISDLAPRPGY